MKRFVFKNLRLFLIFPLSMVNCQLLFSQSSNRNTWLKQLTDSSFHGRGYVNNGDKIAADYLELQFKKLGAVPVADTMRQYFHHNVNTFPDSMRVTFNGLNLTPGVDFIVDSRSGSCLKSYTTWTTFSLREIPNAEKIKELKKNPTLVIWDFTDQNTEKTDTERGNAKIEANNVINDLASTMPVIILTNEKFTWSVSDKSFDFPIIYCQKKGFPIEPLTISIAIQHRLVFQYPSSNVIAMVKAQKKWKKKKYLVYSAHYDHLGRMGSHTYFPGANDNASGTTMLLCLAEYYQKNPPKDFNVLFIAFAGEEAGLRGSEYYVKNPWVPLEKIAFVVNMDIMGTGDEGITVVNALKQADEFALLEKINTEKNYLVKIKKRGETSNSDHYWFDKNGVKSFFVYTMGGIQAYHDVYDKYETLPLTEFEDLFKLLVEFGEKMEY